ncbi:unnamed protein product [Tilletia laevis]|uniref:Uncharacterized protein n=1 Tax=Tilletia laevis TaxID=157183 RepID=A0A9N8M0A7_9BASI|nr:unnamed protein product [Tilletia caries]CAD6926760.1 unnamed protein product [Tilletia caries]CAD6947728.1 unnamed protein product [Tilletia laevis]CAD7065092.1 unnamed protein product [Tilletia caries]
MSDLAQASGSSAPTDLERKNPTAPSPVQPEEIPSVSSDLLPGGFHRYRPNFDTEITTETNLRRPLTDLVITVRVIKSFAFRSMKHLVLQGVDGTVETVGGLKGRCLKDTLKLYTRAHGSKTTNLIINLDHPEWIYDDESKTLAELGIENETELSLFNREDYEHFLTDPQVRWDGDGGSSG